MDDLHAHGSCCRDAAVAAQLCVARRDAKGGKHISPVIARQSRPEATNEVQGPDAADATQAHRAARLDGHLTRGGAGVLRSGRDRRVATAPSHEEW